MFERDSRQALGRLPKGFVITRLCLVPSWPGLCRGHRPFPGDPPGCLCRNLSLGLNSTQLPEQTHGQCLHLKTKKKMVTGQNRQS